MATVPQPQKPASADVSTELRTMSADIGNLRVGQAPQGIKPPSSPLPQPASPAGPALPPVSVQQPPANPAPVMPPAITIPPSSGTGSIKKVIFLVLGVMILAVIGYSLVMLMGSGTEPVAVETETPTPSATPTATLVGKNLRSFFGTSDSAVDVSTGANAIQDLENKLITVRPAAKLATPVSITSDGTAMNAATLLNAFIGPVPTALTQSLGTDWLFAVYGQTEAFDTAGTLSELTTPGAKRIVIVEITDVSAAQQALRIWEGTGLASSSGAFLGYDTSKKIVPGFNDGTFRTIPVRYWNFPYADTSVDYAIVAASNNTNYLVVSASRESMFFAIDRLTQ